MNVNHPLDTARIAQQILDHAVHLVETPEELVAALRAAATIVNERAEANVVAEMRALMLGRARGP